MVKVDLSGKICMVTGANTGIGRVTATELARAGGHVILACRSEAKALPVVEEIKAECGHNNVEFMALDLASLDAVRSSAEAFIARDLPLHILVNNAGLAGTRGTTNDGFELSFGVNHLGHFLFTLLLMERIKASTPARIVNVSSRAHYRAPGIDFEHVRTPTDTYVGMREYEVSKLANVLFTVELAKRLEGSGVTTYSLHPGVVASDIWRRVPFFVRPLMKMFMISNEEGAATSLHCATSPEAANENGHYYDSCRSKTPSKLAKDSDLINKLWAKSLEWTNAPDLKPHASS